MNFQTTTEPFWPHCVFRCGASANSAKLQGHLLFYYFYNRGKSVAIKMSGKPEMSDKNQNLVKTFSGSHIFQFVKQIYKKNHILCVCNSVISSPNYFVNILIAIYSGL